LLLISVYCCLPLSIYLEWINNAYKKEIDLDVKEIILLVRRVIIYDQNALEISEENYTNQDCGHTSGWADLIKWSRRIKR
jgi:hypothetical protein